MALKSSLSTVVDEGSKPLKITFFGSLDEQSEFDRIDFKDVDSAILDLKGLKNLSSSGLLRWSKWIQSLPQEKLFVYHRCPPSFVAQIGTLMGLVPARSSISSFYVPYYDAKRNDVELIEFVYGKHFDDREVNLPAFIKSEEFGNPLEIDVEPKKFFRFLTTFYPRISV